MDLLHSLTRQIPNWTLTSRQVVLWLKDLKRFWSQNTNFEMLKHSFKECFNTLIPSYLAIWYQAIALGPGSFVAIIVSSILSTSVIVRLDGLKPTTNGSLIVYCAVFPTVLLFLWEVGVLSGKYQQMINLSSPQSQVLLSCLLWHCSGICLAFLEYFYNTYL